MSAGVVGLLTAHYTLYTVRTDEPTVDEVIRAIKKLKNGRAAGPDGIPPELLKCAIGPVSRALHSLFTQVWRSGIVPADWQEGIIITLYKGKGPRTVCSNYRPITLSINQSCIFRVVQVTKSLQDPLEVRNNLPGISDNVRE